MSKKVSDKLNQLDKWLDKDPANPLIFIYGVGGSLGLLAMVGMLNYMSYQDSKQKKQKEVENKKPSVSAYLDNKESLGTEDNSSMEEKFNKDFLEAVDEYATDTKAFKTKKTVSYTL